MFFGSGMMFVIKFFAVYINDYAKIASPYIFYPIILVFLFGLSWVFHSNITFKSDLSKEIFAKYLIATIGLIVFEYVIFSTFFYITDSSVISVILVSFITFLTRYVIYKKIVFKYNEIY